MPTSADPPVPMAPPAGGAGVSAGLAEDALRSIGDAIASDRLAHAYLLTGPTEACDALAADVAAGLLCERGPAARGCGACASCATVAAAQHPDVHRLAPPEGKRQIALEDALAFRSALALRPFQGRRAIGIIRGADALGTDAANALLKLIEEPPGAAVVLLWAARASDVLPTIRSRCQGVRLGTGALPPLGEPGRRAVAILLDGEGSAERRAKEILDLAATIAPSGDGREARRAALIHLLVSVGRHLSDVRRHLAGAGGPARGDAPERVPADAARLGPRALERAIERVLDAAAGVDRNLHPEIVLERLVLAMDVDRDGSTVRDRL